MYHRKILNMVKHISDEIYDDKIFIVSIINIFRDNDTIRYIENLKMKLRRAINEKRRI
ncbi:MAG: hypothetical protein ACLT0R_05620 [Paraclostridium sordellii]